VADGANAYGVTERTLYRWRCRYANDSQGGLQIWSRSGRPPKASAGKMAWIGTTFQEETPQELELPYALWTLSLSQKLFRRRMGKTLALSSVSRIMKLLGFSNQKPLYEAWQHDRVLARQCESETYPEIYAEARRIGATIYFADESGIRSDDHNGTIWAPAGQKPVVSVTGRHFSLNMISAVSPQGEFRFLVHQGSVTAPVVNTFLKRPPAGANEPIFLLVEGHPIYEARRVRDFVKSTHGHLRLFFLPPYAPAPESR
jgi:transposase